MKFSAVSLVALAAGAIAAPAPVAAPEAAPEPGYKNYGSYPKQYAHYGSYNYKKYSNYGHYKRDEDVEKREAAPEAEPEPGKYSNYGSYHYKKYSHYGHYKRDEDVEKRGDYSDYGSYPTKYSDYGSYPSKYTDYEPSTTVGALSLASGSLGSKELLLLTVNDILAGVEVDFMSLDATRLGDELVAEDEDQIDGNTQVTCDEGLVLLAAHDLTRLLVADKDVVVLGGDVGESLVGQTLSLLGAAPEDVSGEDGDPGQETEDGGQVDKVAKDLCGVVGDVHEGEQTERSRHAEGVDGNTVLIRVGGGKDKDADTGVDDVGDDADACDGTSNDKGRGRSTGLGRGGKGKLLGVVWDDHADEEDGETVEEEDSVKCELDGAGDGLARVLGLGDCDTDEFGSEVGKGSVDHAGPEAEESSSVAFHDIRLEGTGELLPEFEFTKESDTEVVDNADDDKEYGDKDTRIDCISIDPVLNDEGSSAERKTKRRITESRSVTSETSRHGQPSSHLTKSSHDKKDDKTDNSITDKDRARTSLGESLAGTDNETSSDSTTNGNHGDVSRLEASVERRLGARLETSNVLIFAEADIFGWWRCDIVAQVFLFDVVRRHFANTRGPGGIYGEVREAKVPSKLLEIPSFLSMQESQEPWLD
ncbi:hypothetical protein HG531_012498 [Fusarium graminearum]|nr:hypothetical protein HG531_012498 [Fusarium graminearum]